MAPLTETHRYKAPGVWLPRATTPGCRFTAGPWMCDCAEGHEGPHLNAHGQVIDQPVPGPTAEQVDALISDATRRVFASKHECSPEASRLGRELIAALEALRRRLDAAEQERALILAALGEPCAECGHIDWRSDGASDYYDRVEAAEAEVARLTEALEFYADARHWGYQDYGADKILVWTGPGATLKPYPNATEKARAALGFAGSPAEKGTAE